MDHPRIDRDPDVMVGKPVIKGTRITVKLTLRDIASGLSFAEIADAYPQVSIDDVIAARDYALCIGLAVDITQEEIRRMTDGLASSEYNHLGRVSEAIWS